MDVLRLNAIEVDCILGDLPEERVTEQKVRVDVAMESRARDRVCSQVRNCQGPRQRRGQDREARMNAREVKKAVVLAAGFGTRLRPLTLVEPKPLLPMWGVPMLERIILMLESWGVEEIAVNAHWQAEKIREYVFKRRGKAKVTVADEPEILGTGGVLNPLRGFLGAEPCDVLPTHPVLRQAAIRAQISIKITACLCMISKPP